MGAVKRMFLCKAEPLVGDSSTFGVLTRSFGFSAFTLTAITNFGGAVPSLTTRELGPAPFYPTLQLIDGELKSQSVPVHYQMHWRYRGEGLAMMTPAEYYATTRVVPLPRNMESLSGNEDSCNSEDLCGLDSESEGGLPEGSGQNTKCG